MSREDIEYVGCLQMALCAMEWNQEDIVKSLLPKIKGEDKEYMLEWSKENNCGGIRKKMIKILEAGI